MATTTKSTRSAAAPSPVADPPESDDVTTVDETLAAEPAPAPDPFVPDLVIPDDHDPDKKPPKPTHFLSLACGHRVATLVPVSSHHFCEEDGVTVPVVGRFPIPPDED
jgi:hypothetical protein